MKEVFQAIKAAFDADPLGILNTLTGGRLYYGYTPPRVALPFAVLTPVSGVPADTQTARITNFRLQVSLYSNQTAPDQCWDLARACCEFFEGRTFTVTGHAEVRFLRITEPLPVREENLWAAYAEFRALVQRST